jgi:hypothetical protein
MKSFLMLAAAAMCFAATPSCADGLDSMSGVWSAAPPQPGKTETLTVMKTATGYTTKDMIVMHEKSGTGTSSMNGTIVLGGKPFTGTTGETRACNQTDPNTIRCAVSMGSLSFEEIYALSDGGKTLTDTMKGKDETGKEQTMARVYRRTGPVPAAAVIPGGPQRIVTHNGECEVTVPGGWTVDQSMRQASSPDYGVDVHVFTTDYTSNMKSLADLKALNVGAYKPVKSFEDTPERLWYQYAPHYQNDNGWYVAVLGKTGTCNLEISFKNSVIPDANAAKQIALSLKPAK